MANYTSISKSILDRWTYCNQEAIARTALAMYKERPRNGDIKTLMEKYKHKDKHLLQHIENQDWLNLIIGLVAGRVRVVRATQVIEKGIYVFNFDGPVLNLRLARLFRKRHRPTVMTQS